MNLSNIRERVISVLDTTNTIEVVRVFEDDHILCVAVKFDETEVEFWWCGWEVLASFKYASSSEQARNDLIEFLTTHITDLYDPSLDINCYEDIDQSILILFGMGA